MSFTRDWSEITPIDHTLNSSWPDYDRRAKVDVGDRLADIISGFNSGETALGALKIPFIAVSAPSTVTDQYQLYGKAVGGKTLLHGKDEDGTESMHVGLRSGDVLLSSNTTTPPDFTDVSSTYANKFIRISSTALSTGGADTHTHGAGTYAGPSHTHTGTTSAPSGSPTAGNSGSSASNPSHTHTFTTDAGGTGAVTGTSAAGDNVPAYVTLKAYQKN